APSQRSPRQPAWQASRLEASEAPPAKLARHRLTSGVVQERAALGRDSVGICQIGEERTDPAIDVRPAGFIVVLVQGLPKGRPYLAVRGRYELVENWDKGTHPQV